MYYFFISGKQKCYSEWKAEYTGFLLLNTRISTAKIMCAWTKDAEPIDSDSSSKNGALFHGVRTTCGSLRCPPYKNHTEMLCVVCTI